MNQSQSNKIADSLNRWIPSSSFCVTIYGPWQAALLAKAKVSIPIMMMYSKISIAEFGHCLVLSNVCNPAHILQCGIICNLWARIYWLLRWSLAGPVYIHMQRMLSSAPVHDITGGSQSSLPKVGYKGWPTGPNDILNIKVWYPGRLLNVNVRYHRLSESMLEIWSMSMDYGYPSIANRIGRSILCIPDWRS